MRPLAVGVRVFSGKVGWLNGRRSERRFCYWCAGRRSVGWGTELLLRHLGKFFLDEKPAQNLADLGFGQLVAEFDEGRDFIGGEILLAEGADFVAGGGFACAQDDVGFHGFAASGVRDASDSGFHDFGIAEQYFLDLTGYDVITAGDDEVLFAVDDVEVALFVHFADVACVQCARVVDSERGLVLAVPVAGHDLGPVDNDFTFIPDAKFPIVVVFVGLQRDDGEAGV